MFRHIFMKITSIIIIAAIASASSFIIHVLTVEWLPIWIGQQMQGVSITPSWHVRYVAGITSIEYGLAAITIYGLGRQKLIVFGLFRASLLLALILAAINGSFLRQPFMDLVVGNPFNVALVQNAFKWLVWLLMAFVVVYGFEFLVRKNRKKPGAT